MNHRAYIVCTALALLAVFAVTCVTGDNPFKDPDNVTLHMYNGDDSASVYAPLSNPFKLKIAIEYAWLVDYVTVCWGEPLQKCDTLSVVAETFAETLSIEHQFTVEGELPVRVNASINGNDTLKTAEMIVITGTEPVFADSGVLHHPELLALGASYFLAATAAGTDTIHYTWNKNNMAVQDNDNDTIYFESISHSDTGLYYCVAVNHWGRDTSDSFHIGDTFSVAPSISITVTSPVMISDSAIVRPQLLGIGGTAASTSGIASVKIMIGDSVAALLGTTAWSFSSDELTEAAWNTVRVTARDNNGDELTKTIYLFRMPELLSKPVPAIRERLCTSIELAWNNIEYCCGYSVYRFTSDTSRPDAVFSTPDTSFVDTGLSAGEQYCYTLRAWYTVPGMDSITDSTEESGIIHTATIRCFQKLYGGAADDSAVGIVSVADSQYLIAGTSLSSRPGFADIRLVRADENGDTIWTSTGGSYQDNFAVSARKGAGDEMVVGFGFSSASAGYDNVAGVNVFSLTTGQETFEKILDRPDQYRAWDAMRVSDGGLAFASYCRRPDTLIAGPGVDTVSYICKLSSSGAMVWRKYLAFQELNVRALSLDEGDGAGLFATGVSINSNPPVGGAAPQPHCFVAKISSTGDSLWSRMYGDNSIMTKGNRIRRTSDGGFIVVGETAPAGVATNAYVLKMTVQGVEQWSVSHGGNAADFGLDIMECADGGFAVAGGTWSVSGSDCDAWLLKLDNAGKLVWQRAYGNTGYDCASGVIETADGGYMIAGQTESNISGTYGNGGSDMFVVKTDKNGNSVAH
jgi:hypothetical protein